MINKCHSALLVILLSIANSVSAKEIDPPYDLINIREGEISKLDGFLDYRGEIMFYTSLEAKNLRLVFPYCISAISDIDLRKIRNYDKKMVSIRAKVLPIAPPIVGNGISTFAVVDGKNLKNWCFGNFVLKILDIEIIK